MATNAEIFDEIVSERNKGLIKEAFERKAKLDLISQVEEELPSLVRSYVKQQTKKIKTVSEKEVEAIVDKALSSLPTVKPVNKIIEKTIIQRVEKKDPVKYAPQSEIEALKGQIKKLRKLIEERDNEIAVQYIGTNIPNFNGYDGKVLSTVNGQLQWVDSTSLGSILDRNTFLEVSFGNGNGAEQNFTMTAFGTVNFSGLSGYSLTDPGGNYNPATDFYSIPQDGTYLIMTQIRVTDSEGLQESYGQGAGTANQDSPQFSWFETNGTRNGSLNQRISYFNQGDLIRMFSFSQTGSLHASDGRMQIIRLTS